MDHVLKARPRFQNEKNKRMRAKLQEAMVRETWSQILKIKPTQRVLGLRSGTLALVLFGAGRVAF